MAGRTPATEHYRNSIHRAVSQSATSGPSAGKAWLSAAAAAILLALPIAAALHGGHTASAATIYYPDLQMVVPTNLIQIYHPSGLPKELRFTHITSNLGDGPLEIKPVYDPVTQTAVGYQNLYSKDSNGAWYVASSTKIGGVFYWDAAHGHYHFPLASYGLYGLASDGSVGASVVISSKVGFCIAEDFAVNVELPNAPQAIVYDGNTCTDPTAVRGISVGWGDLYDWTDPGQSIDITSVPDGVYWLRSVVDPNGYFIEKDKSNNARDVKIQIAGDTVKVLNPLLSTSGLAFDQSFLQDGTGTVSTPTFTTAAPGEVLVAFVGSEGPTTNSQSVTISGAGLTWTRAVRRNTHDGTAEVWTANAANQVTGAVTSTQAFGGFDQSLTVLALQGSGGIGATADASGVTGGPAVTLTTTQAGSWVVGVGNDPDHATFRAVGPNQTMVHEWTDTLHYKAYWNQAAAAPIPIAGTAVQLNDPYPTTDRWNFVAVELKVSGWSAGYNVANTPTNWTAGQSQTFNVTLNNTSTQIWPAGGTNPVRLGVHFANTGGGAGGNTWYTDQRFSLSNDVAPGASVTLSINVTAPATAGNLVLEYQMVKEQQVWFAQFSDVNVTVVATSWTATYAVSNTPANWAVNQTQTYTVSVTNSGTQPWPAGGTNPVHLGVHFANAAGGVGGTSWYTDQRFNLPADLAPGASVVLTISVTAPAGPVGNLVVEYQMVKEQQFWFGQFGDANVTLAAASWAAGYTVTNTPASWAVNQTQTYSVTVTNSGSQTWPAGGNNPVHLGVHFASGAGGTWYTDQRFNLPSDLAPGASVVLTISVTAPGGPVGSLVLEYQMVKEWQFWFSQFSGANVTMAAATWSAGYTVSSTPANWAVNQTQTFSVTVTNSGNQTWPAGGNNPVHLGVHFANVAGGAGVNTWYNDQRVTLPNDLAPGASVTLTVSATAPGGPSGNLVLEYQMVKEWQFWFGQFSAANVTMASAVWSANYSVTNTPATWSANQTQTYAVTVTNTGNQGWAAGGSNPVHLGIHFASKGGGDGAGGSGTGVGNGWFTDQRITLPADLAPGGSVTLTVSVTAASNTGNLVLEYQMVMELRFWLAQYSDVNVTVH